MRTWWCFRRWTGQLHRGRLEQGGQVGKLGNSLNKTGGQHDQGSRGSSRNGSRKGPVGGIT